MSLDHIVMYVAHDELEDEIKFMEAAFAHIGFKEKARPIPQVVGLGVERGFYWLGSIKPDGSLLTKEDCLKGVNGHVAISVKDRAQVDEFYKAGITAGGKDNGAPGVRPHYHPNYYGAFVITPAGINMEAVYHGEP